MKKLIWLSILLTIVLMYSCAPTMKLAKNANPKTINVCINYSPDIDELSIEKYNLVLKEFMTKYNSKSHSFKLESCANEDSSSLKINFTKNYLVSPGTQALGILVTVAGALTFASTLSSSSKGRSSFIMWFYYIPHNSTMATLKLSDDIDGVKKPIIRGFSSLPFFGNINEQRIRQAKSFREFLRTIFNELESSRK